MRGLTASQKQKSIEGQKQILKDMFQNGVAASVQLEEWKKSLELKELDRTLLALAVDRICVYEGKKLEITLRYQNVIEKMKVMYEFFSGEFIQKEQQRAIQYMEYIEGKTSQENYRKAREEGTEWEAFYHQRMKELEQEEKRLKQQEQEETKYLRSFLEMRGKAKLNAKLVEALIEKILLYEDGRLEIMLRFKQEVTGYGGG